MTRSDVAIFDKEKKYNIVPERFRFCDCWSNDDENAWSTNQNRHLNIWEVSSIFQWGFSHKTGNHMGYTINKDYILDCPACGYLNVLELIN